MVNRAVLAHRLFTGLSRRHLACLVEELAEPWQAGVEGRRHAVRGGARKRAEGAGARHQLVFVDRAGQFDKALTRRFGAVRWAGAALCTLGTDLPQPLKRPEWPSLVPRYGRRLAVQAFERLPDADVLDEKGIYVVFRPSLTAPGFLNTSPSAAARQPTSRRASFRSPRPLGAPGAPGFSVMVSRHAVARTATALRMRHASSAVSRRLRHALVRHFGEQYTASVLLRSGTGTLHTGQRPCPDRNSPLTTSRLCSTARR